MQSMVKVIIESVRNDVMRLTGEDFGTDYKKWCAWWDEQHADRDFDYDYYVSPLPGGYFGLRAADL